MPKRKSLTSDLHRLATAMKALDEQALQEYTPLVEDIVAQRSRDVKEIAQLLDGLLGFCYDERMLVLFKRLCRHYYFIDPSEAAEYVYLYRDMWDSENIPKLAPAGKPGMMATHRPTQRAENKKARPRSYATRCEL